ncbi:MAG: TFIIB-type zinc ribbon-containing protein, partial [Bifidobacteriaceae bacterium]|nr:TFIIB-type zinc ribbon-containing protein [Bifidobacteriaceae bacterium]
MDYKCPNCGSNVVYDATLQTMRCSSCGSRFDPRQFATPPPA